ncbi:splicing factor KH domain family protein [Babesia bovis T2Bo]|uniref:Branchpoint-bridging protein n=2 Tax=Babesia bovis TaxID=5865 RepID=A7ASH1_BABBO|nr:splicing factor KH domain family protein [Babesia bovis T2Bo]EDO07490.1 splicing factor KH domain family protein [Babesia bovis T2Bo]|eukprot:XP_001611058.1 transcription or splicing factor-like protein [Babesia bovis T2Bo]
MDYMSMGIPVPPEPIAQPKRRMTRWGKIDDGKNMIIHNTTNSFLHELKMLSDKAANASGDDAKGFWGPEDDRPYLPPPYVDLPPGLTPSQMDQFLREQRHDDLVKKIASGELEFGDADIRPPSPPPVYDRNGSRVNTRDVRAKNAMNEEYNRLVEYLLKQLPGFVASADYKPLKKIRKIIIPLDKYPEYNFMGLVIGPRGCNHKRLEAESGAQISLRGRGTLKEGKQRDHQTDEDAAMPMHVHISADKEECVEKAVQLIQPLLDPFHPKHEEFKRKGLEQLALVNGVALGISDASRCSVCGAVGHRAFECPDAPGLRTVRHADVRCAICGFMGHLTSDCKLAGSTGTTAATQEAVKIDQEYNRMMTELTGEAPETLNPEQAEQLQQYQMAFYQQQYQQYQEQLYQQPQYYQQQYYQQYYAQQPQVDVVQGGVQAGHYDYNQYNGYSVAPVPNDTIAYTSAAPAVEPELCAPPEPAPPLPEDEGAPPPM